MKVDSNAAVIDVVDAEIRNFRIGNAGLVINHLTKNLYKYPIKALIRETISNAVDASIEAGNSIDTVTVKTPTMLDSFWTCSDSGIGISPERMDDVFSGVGCSTKSGTNKQHGGFGVGAKSPFAYTKSFMITTVYKKDGKNYESVYTMVSEETSQKVIVHQEGIETDKPTGTLVSIPVLSQDILSFVRYTRLYENFLLSRRADYGSTELFSRNGVSLVKFKEVPESFHGDVIVLLGGIPYSTEIKPKIHLYSGEKILVKMPIGSIQVQLSREEVMSSCLAKVEKRVSQAIEEEKSSCEDSKKKEEFVEKVNSLELSKEDKSAIFSTEIKSEKDSGSFMSRFLKLSSEEPAYFVAKLDGKEYLNKNIYDVFSKCKIRFEYMKKKFIDAKMAEFFHSKRLNIQDGEVVVFKRYNEKVHSKLGVICFGYPTPKREREASKKQALTRLDKKISPVVNGRYVNLEDVAVGSTIYVISSKKFFVDNCNYVSSRHSENHWDIRAIGFSGECFLIDSSKGIEEFLKKKGFSVKLIDDQFLKDFNANITKHVNGPFCDSDVKVISKLKQFGFTFDFEVIVAEYRNFAKFGEIPKQYHIIIDVIRTIFGSSCSQFGNHKSYKNFNLDGKVVSNSEPIFELISSTRGDLSEKLITKEIVKMMAKTKDGDKK